MVYSPKLLIRVLPFSKSMADLLKCQAKFIYELPYILQLLNNSDASLERKLFPMPKSMPDLLKCQEKLIYELPLSKNDDATPSLSLISSIIPHGNQNEILRFENLCSQKSVEFPSARLDSRGSNRISDEPICINDVNKDGEREVGKYLLFDSINKNFVFRKAYHFEFM